MSSKERDLAQLNRFLDALQQFKRLKMEKWEKIDDQIQASIHLGSPTEDWIIPPDERKTEKLLNEDPEYRDLRALITSHKSDVRSIASFLRVDQHHSFDWLNFSSPLIGNAALEDCILFTEKLKKKCKKTSYFTQTIKNLFI